MDPRHDESTDYGPMLFLIIIGLIVTMFALSGCAGSMPALDTKNTTPVCAALIGPIQYNSQKPASPRFAGPKLAPDLKQRNQVGQSLRCPAYK